MLLDKAHERLRWPKREQIMAPGGSGTGVFFKLVHSKIGRALLLRPDSDHVTCGVLTSNPDSSTTEPPIAIVCEFKRAVSDETIREAHRLAWNFSRSPLLITIEPHLIRSWSCCEPPPDREVDQQTVEILDARIDSEAFRDASDQAAHALQWVRLVSGEFFRRRPERFRRDGCADRTLLKELSAVRQSLKLNRTEAGKVVQLDDDTIHDLLARVIFIQFLWDRKDANGKAALDRGLLKKLYDQGSLSQNYFDVSSVLGEYNDAYSLFRWLNGKFNGDLFPGKGNPAEAREDEWREEMAKVHPEHLARLANFISGRVTDGQRWFWSLYSFDVIPLEFISSIYEEFVTEDGAHYTPGFLVDHILDGVLDWEGVAWDVKVLDPSCGSGIFLVKAYQRLIQRWKNAHQGDKISPQILKYILENNIFGVDIDRHAVRVASFSLYLTMCDEIDPNDYLDTLVLPCLRNRTLINADFFQEDVDPIRTSGRAIDYDLIVGNAPWGKEASQAARAWASHRDHDWPLLYDDIGTLFLPKAASLAASGGTISMIQPASSLLFNISGPAQKFRKKLFSEYFVEEVINLSAMRFSLFDGAKSPACVVTLRPQGPSGQPIAFATPKPEFGSQSTRGKKSAVYQLVIDPSDVNFILPEEAANDPLIWPAMSWGGRRDLSLIRRLEKFESLDSLARAGRIASRQGANRGDRRKPLPGTLGMPMISEDVPLDRSFIYLDTKGLPPNEDEYVDTRAGVSMDAFRLPQMIVKQSWQQGSSRFKAVMISSDVATGPAYCTKSYFSVHADEAEGKLLESAWLGLNSTVAVYYLLLTSGQFASAVPKPNKSEMIGVPLPPASKSTIDGIEQGDFDEVDRRTFLAFDFDEVEQTLVSDLYNYTLPDYKLSGITPGRMPTRREVKTANSTVVEPELERYCNYFIKVLRAGFGGDKQIAYRIFQEEEDERLPVRLVAFHLDCWVVGNSPIVTIASDLLTRTLSDLDSLNVRLNGREPGEIFQRRIARVYSPVQVEGREYPTVYVVKPDRIRYWTGSAALRDADETATDLRLWARNFSRYEGE